MQSVLWHLRTNCDVVLFRVTTVFIDKHEVDQAASGDDVQTSGLVIG